MIFTKKVWCCLVAFASCFSLLSCGGNIAATTGDGKAETLETAPSETKTKTEPDESAEIPANNGAKKVIFIGDSFIYYGKTVLEKGNDKLDLSTRVNDKGYFYQLCKENGMNVSVTNFTFGSHGLTSIIGGEKCKVSAARACYGACHADYLTDRVYDIVVVSPGRGSTVFVEELTRIKEMFTAENPNVRLVCLCSAGVYGLTDNQEVNTDILNNLKTAEQMGYTVVDWGGLVSGIAKGSIAVPGSVYPYDKNSFVIRKSETDGHHPNQLAGYLTTLMTYCALTGEKAEGQPFAFATDATVNSAFSVNSFKVKNYVAATTNYDLILQDADEMLRLQKLVDSYLADRAYLNYHFAE